MVAFREVQGPISQDVSHRDAHPNQPFRDVSSEFLVSGQLTMSEPCVILSI